MAEITAALYSRDSKSLCGSTACSGSPPGKLLPRAFTRRSTNTSISPSQLPLTKDIFARRSAGRRSTEGVTTITIRDFLGDLSLSCSFLLNASLSSASVHVDVGSTTTAAARSISASIFAVILSPGEMTSSAVTGTKPEASTAGKTLSRYSGSWLFGTEKKQRRLNASRGSFSSLRGRSSVTVLTARTFDR